MYIKIDKSQRDTYCYEFHLARPNPQNLSNSDFADIEVHVKYMTFNRQNQRQPLQGGPFRKLGVVHANETYPADGKFKPAQFELPNRLGDFVQLFIHAKRGKTIDTDVLIDDVMVYNEPCQARWK